MTSLFPIWLSLLRATPDTSLAPSHTSVSGWEGAATTSALGGSCALSVLHLSCRAQPRVNQEGNGRESDNPFPPLWTPSSGPPPWYKHHSTSLQRHSLPFTSKAQRSRRHGPLSLSETVSDGAAGRRHAPTQHGPLTTSVSECLTRPPF